LAARFAGVDFKSVALKSQAEVKKVVHEEGSVPVLRTSEGSITTTTAIARHFARLAQDKKLLGSDETEEAQVDEFMNSANLEVQTHCNAIMYMLTGRIP